MRASSHPGHPLYCQTHVVSTAPAAHSTSDDRQIVRLEFQTNNITAKVNEKIQIEDNGRGGREVREREQTNARAKVKAGAEAKVDGG